MKKHLAVVSCLILTGWLPVLLRGQADGLVDALKPAQQLGDVVTGNVSRTAPAHPKDEGGMQRISAARLHDLDKLGAFTPDFKKAVHDYVDTKDAILATQTEEKTLRAQVPGIVQQVAEAAGKVEALKKELAEYDHTDETDFVLLQQKMNDNGAKPQDQLVLAQTYVWSYPLSPHEAEAQMYLQQVQKGIADRLQAEKDAEAAKEAARANLIQRAQTKQLSLFEWKDFLQNMSQDDLLKYLGRPQYQQGDYWIYTDGWTLDPALNRRVGLQINFNGGRVINVVEAAPPPATN